MVRRITRVFVVKQVGEVATWLILHVFTITPPFGMFLILVVYLLSNMSLGCLIEQSTSPYTRGNPPPPGNPQ